MSTFVNGTSGTENGTAIPTTNGHNKQYHRISEVRKQQGVSRRSVARNLEVELSEVKRLEDATTDLRLSELFRWQQLLQVPLTHLLEDLDLPLSRPVLERAQFVKLMKTAVTIQEEAQSDQIRRLAEMMTQQLSEIMPELAEVGPWQGGTFGRRLEDYGKIALNPLSDDTLSFASSGRDD